jgi:hypothetical protein
VKKKLRRPLIYAVFAAATVLGVGLGGSSRVLAGPDQCQKNCQNQHCPRGDCSDDQHQKRLNACIKKCS